MNDLTNARPLANDDTAEQFAIFTRIILDGTWELASEIDCPDSQSSGPIPCKPEIARTYFLKAALIELQRCGLAMARWHATIEEFQSRTTSQLNNASVLQLHGFLYEQSVWQRKLAECLSTLICFESTNAPHYYFHYLLCLALETALRHGHEQRDFFGSSSAISVATVEQLLNEIHTVEISATFSATDCWYLKNKTPVGKRSAASLRGVVQSARQQIRLALARATPAERTALGYCYEHAFSRASERIHFSPLDPVVPYEYGQLGFACAQIGLLATRILGRCDALAGISSQGPTLTSIRNSQLRSKSRPHPFAGHFEEGDFVMVFLLDDVFLGEIVGLATTALENESYRVRFLAGLPFEQISEDWVRPGFLRFLHKRDDVVSEVRALLNAALPPSVAVPPLSTEDLKVFARKGAVEMWTGGLQDYAKRCLDARKNKPFEPRSTRPDLSRDSED